MLLESLNALLRAGQDALQTTCGLTVASAHITFVGQGNLTFPALGELQVRNGTLQTVHLGCDTALVGQLAELAGGADRRSGIEVLARRFLDQLLEEMEGRNPQGSIRNLAVAPVTLQTRGVRTFGLRLETEAGQLFLLAEVPSRAELETAKSSSYLSGMIGTYLPRDWRQRDRLESRGLVDSFLVLLRKVEQDVYFELPDGDGGAVLHAGFLVGTGTAGGQRVLKFCVDMADSDLAAPGRGDVVRARAGIDDRSLEFAMPFLGECRLDLAGGASLPCAWFGVPDELRVVQRRRAFRMPLIAPVRVEIECAQIRRPLSPWAEGDDLPTPCAEGRMLDISFTGARIVVEREDEDAGLAEGREIVCLLHFPDRLEPHRVSGVIRRSTLRLADRNRWQEELGIEFLVKRETDRLALEHVREFVLSLQRTRLAQRVHVAGVQNW